jgi:PhnB protein
MKITAYLVFNGQAEEAAKFYADALGGKIDNLHRYGDFPPTEGMPPLTDEQKKLVGHCCISSPDFPGGTLGISDTLPSDPRSFGNGGHMLTLSVDSVARAEAMWAGLTRGAQKIACPLGEAFFAKRYGEFTDRYGILWAVMYEEN